MLRLAIETARIPEMIRGYGHGKARHLAAARPKWDALMAQWRAGPLALSAQALETRMAQGPDTLPLEDTTLPMTSPPTSSQRSEERRVGKECCALCRSRW